MFIPTVTEPPLVQITLGQVVAILSGVTAFIAIVTGAFKLGVLSQRVETNEKTVVQELEKFGARFTAFEDHITATSGARQEWAGWRSAVDAQLTQRAADAERYSRNSHELRNTLGEHATRISVLEADTERAA